eukprot:jgi/Tetstr1/443570/TSEL_031571.t1
MAERPPSVAEARRSVAGLATARRGVGGSGPSVRGPGSRPQPRRTVVTQAGTRPQAPEPPCVDFISSTSNPYVKHCVKLRSNRSYRETMGRVMVTGVAPISEIADSASSGPPVQVRMLFMAEWAEIDGVPGVVADQTIFVTQGVMRKLTGLESVSGVHAVAELCVPGEDDLGGGDAAPVRRLLVLEDVQDPGNVGTLLRTALAFGWDTLFLLPGCCDPFNEKVVRASRGATFRMRRASGTWQELKQVVAAHDLRCLAAEPDPDAKFGTRSLPPIAASNGEDSALVQGVCLVLGNEGQGLSQTAIQACTPVSIPMPGHMESLNVGVAGGILMYLLGSGADDLLAFGSEPRRT